MAARRPAGPLPITIKSYRVIIELVVPLVLFKLPAFRAKGENKSSGLTPPPGGISICMHSG
jgi:hypothetical protein